jgi:hypothetical protein
MNILKQVWECLLDSRKVTPEFEEIDSSSGKLSVEEIMEIAVAFREEAGWWIVEPRHIWLCRENKTGKLIWSVEYLLEGMKEDYYIGTMGIIRIDDETSKIISKGYIPY